MANSKERRKLRRLLLQLGHSPNRETLSHTGNTHTETLQPKARQSEIPTIVGSSRRPGLYLTLLGLLLTAIGLIALIELFPRLSASATSQENPLTPVFNISNDGYLKVSDVTSSCFIWRLATVQHTFVGSSMSRFNSPPQKTLAPTESFPVPCELSFTGVAFRAVDLAIVVYYRPWPFIFLRLHKLMPFSARSSGQPTYPIWDKHPVTPELEHDFNEWLRNWGAAYP
jgi:hypothetical protein